MSEERRAKSRAYYAENREKVSEYAKAYRERHPDRVKAWRSEIRKRRALRGNPISDRPSVNSLGYVIPPHLREEYRRLFRKTGSALFAAQLLKLEKRP